MTGSLEEPEAVPRATRGYAPAPTGQVHYRELGEGSPVLLLHRNPSSSTGYSRVLPLLAAAGFRAVAIDTPGYGLSDRPPRAPTSLGTYADAVVAVLDHLGLERAHLVGYHAGASIACETAASHPDRIDTLVLSAMLAVDPAERDRFSSRVRRWQPDAQGAFLDDWPLPLLRSYVTRDDPDHFLDELIAYLQAGPDYWWAIEALFAYDAFARIGSIQAPTLILQVNGDPLVEESTPRIAAALPAARYVEVTGGHELLYDDPRTFVEPVVEFFRASANGVSRTASR